MGKGKRSKDKKALEILNSEPVSKKQSSVNVWTRVMLISVALILVASLALVFIQSSGILLRIPHALKTENFEVTGAMMQYLVKAQYNAFYSTYGAYLGYMSLDINKPLKDQKFGASSMDTALLGEFEGSWYDYFWSKAEAQAKQVLIYCEAAHKQGVTLSDEDKEFIDKTIKSFSEEAKANNFPSTKSYLYALYGEGIKKSDIRKMLEMSELAAKFFDQETEKILDSITDEKVREFFEENKSDYYKADYVMIEFVAEINAKDPKNPTQEEIDQYISDVALAKEHAETVSKMDTVDAIKDYMIDFWFEQFYTTYYDTAIEEEKKNGLKTEDIPTDEAVTAANKKEIYNQVVKAIEEETKTSDLDPMGSEKFDKVLESTRNKLITQLNSKLNSMVRELVAFSDSTDEANWIFAEDRKEGDSLIVNSDEKKEEDKKDEPATTADEDKEEGEEEKKTYDKVTSTLYYMVKPRYIREQLTVEFGHILISGDSFKEEHDHDHDHDHDHEEEEELDEEALDKLAKEKADELLADFLAGEVTKEAFEVLAKENTEDSGIFYEDVKPGEMVLEIEDWIFEEGRKAGDTTVIKTEYGYHVTYFVEYCKEIWFVDSKDDLYDETVENWYNELEKATNVEINKKIADRIEL